MLRIIFYFFIIIIFGLFFDLYQPLRLLDQSTVFSLASCARSYRATDEALIAEPRYGPSSAFLVNIFFAPKGSYLFWSYYLYFSVCL